jgi:hypothetical protein
MSIGSILVGVALVLGVGAYLARPFRRGRVDLDRAIETWVSQVRVGEGGEETAAEAAASAVEGAVNYCAQCGRRLGPDDRFCAGCGKPLPGGGE